MDRWEDRPTEVANLLNPAFTGALLRRSLEAFSAEARGGMPFGLAFLVLPMALHPGTARRFPARAASTPLHAWLQREENRDVLISFGERVRSLVPFTREALLFAAQRGIVVFDDDGRLTPGTAGLRGITNYREAGVEVKEAFRRSEFVGRWFALSGTTTTIFTILGVRP